MLLRDLAVQNEAHVCGKSTSMIPDGNLAQRFQTIHNKCRQNQKPMTERQAESFRTQISQLEGQKQTEKQAIKIVSDLAHKIYTSYEVSLINLMYFQ